MSLKWNCTQCNAINPACSGKCHNCGAHGAFIKGPEWHDDWVPLKQWLSKQKTPIHVVPIKDIKEHEESLNCWCVPKICSENQDVILHNAFAAEYGDERNLE